MADPLELLMKIIADRRSVRAFDARPIPEEVLRQVFEAARLAPSSNNTQPWRFILVTDESMRKKLSLAMPLGTPSPIKFIAHAPAIVVCCAKPHVLLHKAARFLSKDFHEVDLAIAIEHLVLAATAMGIGSCWIGWFSENKVRQLLSIPSSVHVAALLPLGYPAALPPRDGRQRPGPLGLGGLLGTPRRPLSELVCKDTWNF